MGTQRRHTPLFTLTQPPSPRTRSSASTEDTKVLSQHKANSPALEGTSTGFERLGTLPTQPSPDIVQQLPPPAASNDS
eukprot:4050237-Amphidinium_carterae.2